MFHIINKYYNRFIYLNKLVYYFYNFIYVCFSQGGTGVPCPPFSVVVAVLMLSRPSVPGGWW